MIRVYVSGPMTGLPEYNFPAFHAAAAALREHGLEVVNPAELSENVQRAHLGFLQQEPEWADFVRADLRAMLRCEAVVTLPGWENSKGALLELHVAKELGMPIMALADFLDDEGSTTDRGLAA